MTETHTNVSAVMRLLLGATRSNQRQLAEALNVDDSTITRRLKPQARVHWRIDEVEAAARFFDVPVDKFFQDAAPIYEQIGLKLSTVTTRELAIFQLNLFDQDAPEPEVVVDLREPEMVEDTRFEHAA